MCAIMFLFVKQKTAYEMRISDWSSDVCSSDLPRHCQSCHKDRTHWADSFAPAQCVQARRAQDFHVGTGPARSWPETRHLAQTHRPTHKPCTLTRPALHTPIQLRSAALSLPSAHRQPRPDG